MAEKIFANGLVYKAPRERAPDYVKGSLSFKVEEFVAWLQEHQSATGWVNVQIKESKGGKLYCELDTWKPGQQNEARNDDPEPRRAAPAAREEAPTEDYPTEDINPDDIPF